MKEIVVKKVQMQKEKVIKLDKESVLYVGIDMHKKSWAITMMAQGRVLRSATIAPSAKSFLHVLSSVKAHKIKACYEAGCFGYSAYDQLERAGIEVIVVAPSKVLKQPGSRVKTDRRDSLILAEQLAAGLLTPISVPDPQRRAHRQVLRTFDQINKDRTRTMQRLKALLLYHGVDDPFGPSQRWSSIYINWLGQVKFSQDDVEGCIGFARDQQLNEYLHLSQQRQQLKDKLKQIATLPRYREAVAAICRTKGVGKQTALRLVLEIGYFGAFKNSRKFCSYLGLTPSERSSGENKRSGSITRCGNIQVRSALVEVAWQWIRYDLSARSDFKRLCYRAGAKRAIVAMARRLSIRLYWTVREVETVQELQISA